MFARLFNKNRPAVRKPIRSRRPMVEALEDRALMSGFDVALPASILDKTGPANGLDVALPVALGDTNDSGRGGELGGSAGKAGYARFVDLQTTPRHVVHDKLNGAEVDTFRVRLKQGEFLAIDVDRVSQIFSQDFSKSDTTSSMLEILDGDGDILQTIGSSLEPHTGKTTNHPAASFIAPVEGDYFLRLTSNAAPGSYSMELHRLSLAEGRQDPVSLKETGAMYAFLQGDRLAITGPTGYGFAIRGNWVQTTTTTGNLTRSTYSATGEIFVETAAGLIGMPIPEGTTFSVTTKANVFGHAFGPLDGMNFTATVSLPVLTGSFTQNNPFGDLAVSVLNYTSTFGTPSFVGVKLGSETILQQSGAPLHAAVPYLFVSVNPASSTPAGGLTSFLNIIADPADPSLYIGASIPGLDFPIKGLGFSRNGMIPFTPNTAPSQYHGTIGGHFYIAGTIDLTGVTGVPAQIDGNITLDLDPAHTGQLLGGASITPSELVRAIHSKAARASLGAELDKAFRNFTIGVNGLLKVSPFDKIEDALPVGAERFAQSTKWIHDGILGVSVPRFLTIGQATFVYDGPTLGAYLRGGTVNPFEGTPIAVLGSQTALDVDVALLSGGKFYLDITGKYNIGVVPATGHVMILNNYPVSPAVATLVTGVPQPMWQATVTTSGIYAQQRVSALGVTLDLTGRVRANGTFSLTGSADLNFGPLKGRGSFELAKTSSAVYFTTGIDAEVKWEKKVAGIKWKVKGSLSGKIKITRTNNGGWKFEGTLKAKGKVTSSIGSAKFDFKVEVKDGELVLKVPHLGKKTINLP